MTEFEQIQIEQLKRIADVLENINGALINMGVDIEALGNCVGYVPPNYYQKEGYHIIRIGGSIDAGNY